MQEEVKICRRKVGKYIKGIKLTSEHQNLYAKEEQKRSVFNLRFFNIAVLIAVTLFSLIEHYQTVDQTVYRYIILVRIILIIAYIIPFIVTSLSINKIKNHNLFLALNAFGFIVYFALQSILSSNYPVALFYNTIAIFLLNICLYLILGIQFRYAVILSSMILLVINLNYSKMPGLHESAITLSDLNFWFVVTTIVVSLVARNIENLLKKSFQTNLELKEANQTKYKLFSMVSHDLKNMISAQYTIADYLKDDNYKLNEADRNRMIDILHGSSQDVLTLFDDLMDWIKTQIETMKPNYRNVDLEDFNKVFLNQMMPAAERKNIQLVIKSETTDEIITDPNILGLILRNLLGNAIKYSFPDSTITIHNTTKNGFIEYQITDTGIGMSSEQVKELFDFENIRSLAGTAGEKGTGLGLKLTKELLGILNGTLQVESSPQKGTVVFFKLPNEKKVLQANSSTVEAIKYWVLN